MKLVVSFCLLVMTVVAATAVYADIAKPKSSPTKSRLALHTSLSILPDSKAYEARLQIHESSLKSLRAALDEAQGRPTIAASIGHSSTRTIMAGMLLFLSLSFAGVWLARSVRAKSSLSRTVVVFLLAVATIGAAVIITRANAGPPGYYNWKNLPQNLDKGRETVGGLDIEILPDDPNVGSGVTLIIPLRKQSKPGEDE
jgi:hypothetical protein